MSNIPWRDVGNNRRLYYAPTVPNTDIHPWKLNPCYMGKETGWAFSVRPGFVNGVSPLVTIPKELADTLELEKPENKGKDFIDVEMFHDVTIPLKGLKRLTGTIPQYFKALGVKDVDKATASAIGTNAATGGITLNLTKLAEGEDREGDRMLWASEVFLSKARATYELQSETPANLVTGQIVEYTVVYNTTSLYSQGSRARLRSGEMPRKKEQSMLDRLKGDVGDVGEDYLLVATVYLLSPPVENASELPKPDGTWQDFVSYSQFWNLCHEPLNEMPKNITQSGLDPFLAYFVGRYTFAPAATFGAGQAALDSMMAALQNDHNNEGYWWSV